MTHTFIIHIYNPLLFRVRVEFYILLKSVFPRIN